MNGKKEKNLPMNPEPPKMYGLIKLHKEGNPCRPVVSYTTAPAYHLAKNINEKFRQVTNFQPKNTVINSIDLAEKLSSLPFNSHSYKLVSFDVSNMFPNIPTRDCIPLIKNTLEKSRITPQEQEEYITLFKECLEQNYFTFNNQYYIQNTGLPMGSPLSPLLADIYMNEMEVNLLKSPHAKKHILFWFRYVDDILVGFQGTDRQMENFLEKINNINSKIQFTMEKEENNKINFLDISIQREDGKLTFNIYRKPTFTDVMIPTDSHSAYTHKMSAFRSMVHRAFSIPMKKETRESELNIIREIAKNNGFTGNDVENIIRKKQQLIARKLIYPKVVNLRDKTYISIPYMPQATRKIGNIFKKQNITTAFQSGNSLGKLLFNSKSKSNLNKKSGVYKLECPECKAAYVGQTGRSFEVRIKEHLKSGTFSNFREHLEDSGHIINETFQPRILHICNKGTKLNLLEAIEINKINQNKNIILLNDQTDLNKSRLLNLKFR